MTTNNSYLSEETINKYKAIKPMLFDLLDSVQKDLMESVKTDDFFDDEDSAFITVSLLEIITDLTNTYRAGEGAIESTHEDIQKIAEKTGKSPKDLSLELMTQHIANWFKSL